MGAMKSVCAREDSLFLLS